MFTVFLSQNISWLDIKLMSFRILLQKHELLIKNISSFHEQRGLLVVRNMFTTARPHFKPRNFLSDNASDHIVNSNSACLRYVQSPENNTKGSEDFLSPYPNTCKAFLIYHGLKISLHGKNSFLLFLFASFAVVILALSAHAKNGFHTLLVLTASGYWLMFRRVLFSGMKG